MLDAVAEFDEQAMEKYLNGQPLTEEEIRRAIRAGMISMKMTPVCADRLSRIRVCSSCWMGLLISFLPHLILHR